MDGERQALRTLLEQLNKDSAEVSFEPLVWENSLSSVGPRAQSVINEMVDRCDVFILMMHREWGQPAPDSEHGSYTEEEYYRALNRWENTKSPCIWVFLKNVDAESIADPGPQLKKVLKFRRQLEKSGIVLYKTFEDEHDFRSIAKDHLQAYVGDTPRRPADSDERVVFPTDVLRQVEQAWISARASRRLYEAAFDEAKAEAARAAEYAFLLARLAARDALQGRVEDARESFAKIVPDTSDISILHLAFEFYQRTGELAEAESVARRWLALSAATERSVL